MSVEEALVSSDPEVIKVGRKTVKGKITSKVKYLKSLLEAEDLIDGKEINERLQIIEDQLELFQQLHEGFLESRQQNKDKKAENDFLAEQDVYQDEVIKKVCSIKSLCKQHLNKIDAGVKSEAFEASKVKLGYVKKDAQKIIDSADSDIKKSAQLVHKSLDAAFDFVHLKYDDY